jgi:hypothetical protein
MRDKHGGHAETATTVRRMVCEMFKCDKDPGNLSTPVQLSPHPFTSVHCEMAHVPGKLSDSASQVTDRKQGGRHSASHDSESTEVAVPLVS